MMWNYVQFPDETQIAYSDVREDGTVRIDIERPATGALTLLTALCPPTSGRASMDSPIRRSRSSTRS